MKVGLNTVSFGVKKIKYHNDTHNIMEIFDVNNRLKSRTEYDKLCRDLDSKEFDENRKIVAHLHKEYTSDGCTETFKSESQEYTRETKTFIKDKFTHYVEKFTSKTSPKSSYINEFVRDAAGKLIKVICNGKVIYIA